MLCHYLVLQSPDFRKPFLVATDASDDNAGALLLQHESDNVKHPVAYFFQEIQLASKKLFNN